MTGNAFQAFLTRADQEALWERVRAQLHDEGLFAFETRNPRWASFGARDKEEDWQTYAGGEGHHIEWALIPVHFGSDDIISLQARACFGAASARHGIHGAGAAALIAATYLLG